MKNILSIDLESWIHFYEDALKIKKFSPEKRMMLDEGYIINATMRILDLLDKYEQKATFFVVSELYDWHPELIEEIKKRGHEIGYHTHTHPVLKNSEILRSELEKSARFIKRFRPVGFRAPQIYLTEDSMKYLEEEGFRYSSSSYDSYHINKYGKISEIPVSSISIFNETNSRELPKSLSMRLLSKRIPFGSGLFISLLGSYVSYFIKKLNRRNIPAIIFVHPWQIYQVRDISSSDFRFKVLIKNPLCIPYTRNVSKSFEKLLKHQKFTSYQEYYYGQRSILG